MTLLDEYEVLTEKEKIIYHKLFDRLVSSGLDGHDAHASAIYEMKKEAGRLTEHGNVHDC